MLNGAKYKSCLTLLLTSPNSNSSSEKNSTDVGATESSNEIIPEKNGNEMNLEMNLSQSAHQMNQTIVRNESFNQTLDKNETIIPIKCLSHEEKCDSNQFLNNDASTENSPKYCCTLEVKFVWYESKSHNSFYFHFLSYQFSK